MLNDVSDVNTKLPGLLTATHEWFRIYKMPTGKPENKFAFNGEFKDRKCALEIIEQTHTFWKKLITSRNPPDGLCTQCHVPDAVRF